MSGETSDEERLRTQVRRALQVMNLYSLTEFEYEDKDGDTRFRIRRDDQEGHPPLLEGRSARVAGEVRAPTVGRVDWEADEGDVVQRGQQIATMMKNDEPVPVKAPIAGELVDLGGQPVAEYGDRLARIAPLDLPEEEAEES